MKETAVLPHLTTRWLGHKYHFLETTTSTNDVLKAMADAGAAAGTAVATDFQSQGRGRLGRRWEAAPGTSLMLSLLFCPDWPAERALWLTMIAGLAAAEAIESLTPLSISLKWPNDVGLTLADGWRKLGGLLVEGELDENGRFRQIIVGMGLNVNMTSEQLPEGITPVTSLLAAGGEPVDRVALLLAFLARMETWYETAVGGQSPQPAWQARLVTLGRSVQVTQGDEVLVGTAVGVDEWGQLLLRTQDGQQHTIAAGDVSLRAQAWRAKNRPSD